VVDESSIYELSGSTNRTAVPAQKEGRSAARGRLTPKTFELLPAVDLLAVFVKRPGGAAIVLDLGQPVGEERAEGA
jgi:hypothetical protein